MLGFILDSLKGIMYISFGFIFGLVIGVTIALTGFHSVFFNLAHWIIIFISLLFSLGLFLLIALITYKKNKIEKIKND